MKGRDVDLVRAYLASSGRLRVSINLGNPVLAQGTPQDPAGVTVDIAREVSARLGVTPELVCFDAARDSYAATVSGVTQLCFLAIEPAREDEIAFTPAYALIDTVYVVPRSSPIVSVADVDRRGVRIGVKRGSAYDLFLTRTLQHAELVRGDEGVTAFVEGDLEVGAGLRAPATAFAEAHPGIRVVDEPFMQVRQALGTRRDAPAQVGSFLTGLVEELKASGFVEQSLHRSGQRAVTVAPPYPETG